MILKYSIKISLLKYILFLFIFQCFSLSSQTEYLDFRSATNPLYWKNRKPYEGYWQQDVHYNIKAEINDSSDILSGVEELIYWNNSPFDISYVYFHLYSNGNTKDSYSADLYKNNNYNLKFGKYRGKNLGTEVETITVNGQELKTELDNTILKVYLPKVLKSGESTTFKLNFKTYFDKEAIRNRMKMFNSFGKKHYDVVHWYPRITVIDRKFGWNTDQHMDHEFYGDFGSFYVEMTMPNDYVADGTGTLINEKEVLPDTLKRKLNLANFLKKPFNSTPSTIIKKDGSKKTWKFSAINVHDFAFTADPNYRIGETNWNGVRCIALVQEPHAAGWYNAPQYIAKTLDVNSYNIGPYHHPKMIVADAQDGMEYPMLVLCGGFDPDYRTLLIHEMTHNWFQGMLGTNENYRAYMDEGFTQFYTADTYQFIDGPLTIEPKPKSKYIERFTEPSRILDDQIYNSFYNNAVIKGEETPLNTHADDFNGAIRHGGGYGQSYTKTAAMLKNLEYVLGRALFDKSMQHYFDQWKFAHPYPEDFRNSIIMYAGIDLNWFFDEWLETSKTIDYKVGRIKRKKKGVYEITFKRKGSMQMPIDFAVIDANDSARHFYIPNTWFERPTRATTLPRWIGWGPKLKTTYTATLDIGTKIKNVIIDPSYRLADVDMTNNSKHGRISLRFDSKVYNPPNWKRYDMRVRPGIWYNGYDGAKIGAVLSGDYLRTKHVFEFGLFFSSGLGQAYLKKITNDYNTIKNKYNTISFWFDYKTATNRFIKKSNIYLQAKSLDGLDGGTLGFEKKSNNEKTRVYTHLKAMWRDLPQDMVYLINPQEWGYQKLNSAIHIGLEHDYRYRRGTGNILLNVRTAAFTNDYDFSAATLSVVNKNDLGKININTRVFGQIGFGNKLPSESMLFAAGANNEELMGNKYTRSMGIIPPDWGGYGVTTNHFTAGGGLNLRGFSGYLLAQQNSNGSLSYNYKGTTGISINTEIEFGEFFKRFNPKFLKNSIKIQPYLFGDVGSINTNSPDRAIAMSDVMGDAGIGTTLSIVRWGKLYGIKPLTIRFDCPFFISRLPFAEKDYFQFRWMLGINKSF
ncbi:M1 family metallopeptidase [Aurantibacillus circumpalustris]|uniref:M1 family metallopeptidase n=1 Tax=Aurantibacillus circumpalustris TaxID=3036359 RepID=UPI00295B2712|nr:M1 family aminopeptidase [Aurantibacillus circumpalustris]